MLGRDHRELLGAQAHEIADGEEPHQVDESLQERLVEGRVALLAHDGPDARGGESLPVRTVAPERLEDVSDSDDHRTQVERPAADAFRIPAQILLEMMLER